MVIPSIDVRNFMIKQDEIQLCFPDHVNNSHLCVLAMDNSLTATVCIYIYIQGMSKKGNRTLECSSALNI